MTFLEVEPGDVAGDGLSHQDSWDTQIRMESYSGQVQKEVDGEMSSEAIIAAAVRFDFGQLGSDLVLG